MTLLEMLVVLMIAGMALALGFQALGQWRRTDASISEFGSRMQQQDLARDWLQLSLRSLIPVADLEFEGSADRLSGVSLQPLLASQGGEVPITWRIGRDASSLRLEAEESGQVMQIPLTGAVDASFSYVDKEHRTHPQWPPALGQHDHLPALVLLRIEGSDGTERLWGARIVGIRNPVPTLYELEQD